MNQKLLNYFNGDDLAASVWQSKYQQEGEETPDDMHRRLAKEFARIETNYQKKEKDIPSIISKLSSYGYERMPLDEKGIYNLFKNFKYIVPQGSVMSQLGAKSIGSLSNCFVIGQVAADSYGGIFQTDEEMAQLMKRRGGVGTDISSLRPKGTETSNAAKTSTGAVTFTHRYSNTTREVAQNGRRGALMISMSINHPDSLDFIKAKRDLTQLTGANISVKLNKEFMKAVVNDEDYFLRFPVNHPVRPLWKQEDIEYNKLYITPQDGYSSFKKIRAREYWNEIIKSAHNVAEPGILFEDNHLNYSPDGVYEQYKGITTNPCGEIFMQAYDACRLIAVNLYSFVENPFTANAKFNFTKFYEINYEAMRLSDDLVDLEIEAVNKILTKIMKDPESSEIKEREFSLWVKIKETMLASRRTGLGFTALGDTLAALDLKYDSDEAINMIRKIMHTKLKSELDCTTDLAILRGTFKDWNKNKEFDLVESNELVGKNTFYNFIAKEFPTQALRMYDYGRRNISFSALAPTGTVSLMTQTTSGIEPLFQPYYKRRKKVNSDEKNVKISFVDKNGDAWQEFIVIHPKFKKWIEIVYDDDCQGIKDFELEVYFRKSPWYKSTANVIDWIKRVEIQSVIQKYITHSISSTINLPKEVSEEEVSEIYLESWKRNLKGITVYRDGSRDGVLIKEEPRKEKYFTQHDAPKRPKELEADYYFATSRGRKYAVIVGLLEDKPYELFAFEDPLSEEHLKGKIIKVKRGTYKFESDRYTIKNLQLSSENSDEKLLTRWISLGLRHGIDAKYIVEQTEKSDLEITAFAKVIVRILKKYIPNGTKSTMVCQECGSKNIIFQEGCQICQDCGSSKCG